MYYNVELEWMVPGAPADLTSLSLSLNMLASAGKDRIKDKTDRRRGLEGFEPRRAHELSRTQWWMPGCDKTDAESGRGLGGFEPPPGTYRFQNNFNEGARGFGGFEPPPSTYHPPWITSYGWCPPGDVKDGNKSKKADLEVLGESNPRRAHTIFMPFFKWGCPGWSASCVKAGDKIKKMVAVMVVILGDSNPRWAHNIPKVTVWWHQEIGGKGIAPYMVVTMCARLPMFTMIVTKIVSEVTLSEDDKNSPAHRDSGLGGIEPPPSIYHRHETRAIDGARAARCLNADGRQIDAGAAAAGGVRRGNGYSFLLSIIRLLLRFLIDDVQDMWEFGLLKCSLVQLFGFRSSILLYILLDSPTHLKLEDSGRQLSGRRSLRTDAPCKPVSGPASRPISGLESNQNSEDL
ncbi:hypothetical protein DFH09DRAFT_1091594 [Mycena vulgaris]|nr:hypothetical protein DFH09DRAFT_1091594 [Mycena vulgaris]